MSLVRIQKDQQKNISALADDKDLLVKRDQLREELKLKKNELKEKQNILRLQEKHMKDQHENLIKMDEKCRKLSTLINEKKAGIKREGEEEGKTQADVDALDIEIKELERKQIEDKKKYKVLISTQENKIKDLSLNLEKANLELKMKDQVNF